MSHRLTVSIVTYNSAKDLPGCLASLAKQTLQNFDLIIIDNGSTDETISIVNHSAPEALLLHSEGNVGFGAAHNLAISRAKTEWILILNADTVLEPSALETLVTAPLPDSIGAVSGILYTDTSKRTVDSTGIVLNPLFYHAKERKQIPPADDYPWGLTGACVLLNMKALKDIAYERHDRSYPEYFDESFFLYKEDLDLAARLRAKGWRSYFVNSDIGIHMRSGAVERSRHEKPEYIRKNSYKNHFYFLLKHANLYALPFIGVYEASKFIYLLFLEPSTLSVLPEMMRAAPKMLKRRYV